MAARRVIERDVTIPALVEVAAVRSRLAGAVLKSGGNKLAIDAKLMIDQMTEGLRKSEQGRFIADQAIAGYARAFREIPAETRAIIRQLARDSREGYEPAVGRTEVIALVAFLHSIWPGDDPDNPLSQREVADNDA